MGYRRGTFGGDRASVGDGQKRGGMATDIETVIKSLNGETVDKVIFETLLKDAKKPEHKALIKNVIADYERQETQVANIKLKKAPTIDIDKEALRAQGYVFFDAKGNPEIEGEAYGDTFTLSGNIGKFLGTLQKFMLSIVITGETHSSKSQFVMQLVNAFLSNKFTVAFFDLEQGGVNSKDTQAAVNRHVAKTNRPRLVVIGKAGGLNAIRQAAGMYDVVAIDSGGKLGEKNNAWIDVLRNEFKNTIFVIIMQQTTNGNVRGGSAAEYDTPILLNSHRPDKKDYKQNYVSIEKNRGNPTNLIYKINQRKITRI